MPNPVSGDQGIRAICSAKSKTRPLFSPARWQPRRQVANGANRIRVRARTTDSCNASNYQSPATFFVRSSSAVRPLFVGNCHDRAISQAETQLQASPVSAGHAHAAFQLVSFPALKGAGSSTFVAPLGITWRSTSLLSVAGRCAINPRSAD